MNYIYETPWWLPTGIALLGVILFVTGNNRLEKRIRLAGILTIALAVILAVVSFFLDSDREKVVKRTYALVDSVEKGDWNRMGTYLHPNVAIAVVFSGRDAVVSAARNAAEYSNLRSVRVVSLDATVLPDQIRTTLRVNTTLRDGTGLTDWVLEWEEVDGNWLVHQITPEGGPGITGGMLEDYIKSRGR